MLGVSWSDDVRHSLLLFRWRKMRRTSHLHDKEHPGCAAGLADAHLLIKKLNRTGGQICARLKTTDALILND